MARRGEVGSGKAVMVGSGMVGSGQVWRLRCGRRGTSRHV